jgi:hypothetical protein
MGRNSLRTQYSQNFDLSLFKEVSVEHLTVQLRAETFDALNHKIFGEPNATLGSTTFGVINTTNNSPRSVQLGVKVLF